MDLSHFGEGVSMTKTPAKKKGRDDGGQSSKKEAKNRTGFNEANEKGQNHIHETGDETKIESVATNKLNESDSVGESVTAQTTAQETVLELANKHVAEIARREVEKWHAEQKFNLKDRSTWGANFYWTAAVILVLVIVIFAELLSSDEQIVRDFLHNRLATDARVSKTVKEMMSGEVENKMRNLVFETVERSPILAFHGQAMLGANENARIINPACKSLMETSFNPAIYTLPENSSEWDHLPKPVEIVSLGDSVICETDVAAFPRQSLDVPFYGKFYSTQKGRADRVQVVLEISRSDRISKERIVEPDDESLADKGLCILYNSDRPRKMKGADDKAQAFNITDLFNEDGRGHWVADLGTFLESSFGSGLPVTLGSREHLHSVTILHNPVPASRDDPSDDSKANSMQEPASNEEKAEQEICAGVSEIPNQIVNVQAIILTNKRFDERTE